MTKKEPLGENIEPPGNRSKLIKPLIIGGTFAAIAALSILTQENGGGWPAPSVIAIRFGLLSGCSLVYFWMLSRTKAGGEKEKEKPRRRKR